MLPAENRLRKAKDIERVYKKGRRYKCPLFLLITLAREKSDFPTRYAIVISKRTAPSAVQRNRGKRVLHGLIRPLLHRQEIGHDVIVVVSAKFFEKKSDEIEKELKTALERAKLLKEK